MSSTFCLTARNVNNAFVDGLWYLKTSGIKEDSRNGPVLVAPGSVVTEYLVPTERVLWDPVRDANPVFHLMEAIWMLAGDARLTWLAQFNAGMMKYAEPGGYQHGAYGHRWRRAFGLDQIPTVVDVLKHDPNSRQAVLQMWHAPLDLGHYHLKDRPCNTHVYFDLRGGVLNMTVCCRSNDMLWGAYGANAVHFSVLQEVVAAGLGRPVGVYRQFSNNYHLYTDVPVVKTLLENTPTEAFTMYGTDAEILPLVAPGEDYKDLLVDAIKFVSGAEAMRTKFMTEVAVPLRDAYLTRKEGKPFTLSTVADCDWKLAFIMWMSRRENKDAASK